MNVVKLLVVLFGAALMSACSTLSYPKTVENITNKSELVSGKSFYVAVTKDGGSKTFIGKKMTAENSGEEAAAIIYDRLKLSGVRVVQGGSVETEEEALSSAESKGLDYVIYPTVKLWIDPNYFSCAEGHYDRSEVEVGIYSVLTSKAISIDRLDHGGCPIDLMGIHLGANSPGDRFKKVLFPWLDRKLGIKK